MYMKAVGILNPLQILFCAACSFAKVVLVYQKIADENREFLDKNQLLTN